MSKFKEAEFDPPVAAYYASKGITPVKFLVCQKPNGVVVCAIVTDDPSGENDAVERCVSVSASQFGVRRMPTRNEVMSAVAAVGWEWSKCSAIEGNNVVTVYQS